MCLRGFTEGVSCVIIRIILLVCLTAGFLFLFLWMERDSILRNAVRKTFDSMDAAARRRVWENRKLRAFLEERKGVLYKLEQDLLYSGLAGRFRFLTPELCIVGNLAASAGIYFLVVAFCGSWLAGGAGIAVLQAVWYLTLSLLKGRNYRRVNDNLMKFLDFLGNYSITAGEVTGIFNQISKYLDEPLRSVLDECYYEAQTCGDTGLALLTMAQKIEHPRFKELVRNIEISARYCADFTALVANSRRALREHMRTRQERKSMVYEAMVNMLILGAMAVFILMMVGQLIDASIWDILLHTLPGRICITVIMVIFILMYRQIRNLDR